jgi:hypothetical protein
MTSGRLIPAGSDGREQLLYFRGMTVASHVTAPASLLADVRIVPPRPHTFAALDDAGLTLRGSCWEAAHCDAAVSLAPGEQYEVTLVMDTSAGPFRECAYSAQCRD